MKPKKSSEDKLPNGYLVPHQAVHDWRNGLITFNALRAICVAWANDVMKTYENKMEATDKDPAKDETFPST